MLHVLLKAKLHLGHGSHGVVLPTTADVIFSGEQSFSLELTTLQLVMSVKDLILASAGTTFRVS